VKTGILAVLALLLVTAEAANQQSASKTQNAEEQRLLALEQLWMKAEIEHDRATLMRILDASFVATVGSNKPLDKAAFIEEMMHLTVASQTAAHDIVHIYDDAAVIVGIVTVLPADRSQQAQAIRYTTTYLKRHGNWVAVAEQLRLVAP